MNDMSKEEYKRLEKLLREQDARLESRLERIENALLSDDELGSKGLVERYTEIEKQVEKNTSKLDKIWVYITLIGTTIAAASQYVFKSLFG